MTKTSPFSETKRGMSSLMSLTFPALMIDWSMAGTREAGLPLMPMYR